MKIFNNNKESSWNSITEILIVLAFIGFALGAIMSSFVITSSLMSIFNVAISLFMVYITLRLLDNNRIAMYVFFAYLLLQVIFSFVMPETTTKYWIVTFVLYVFSFCLTKNGEATWSIIYNSPQDRGMDSKDKKLFYFICIVSAVMAIVGLVVELIASQDS